ncbi:hypothetical protein V495_02032 [Pseudogymnoascus sp. VKM F-4514 (FW-929)]|nr:hypothetical protein V495_02032 [Pseudogymnoascus sp. VKM F-4514 (FW-929)]KFY61590.1 hypothetical protein V497_02860 [Pseudogymnoascus sp. VKM F-4516 (FW-969)]
MKLASKSAIESDNSANAGSKTSSGASELPPTLDLPDSRKDDFDEGRRGVVGREVGRRVPELDRLMLLSSGLFDADIFIVAAPGLLLYLFRNLVMLGGVVADSIHWRSVYSGRFVCSGTTPNKAPSRQIDLDTAASLHQITSPPDRRNRVFRFQPGVIRRSFKIPALFLDLYHRTSYGNAPSKITPSLMPAVSDCILVHARLFGWKSPRNSVQKPCRHLPFVARDNRRTIPTFRNTATLLPKRQLSSCRARENKLPLISTFSQLKQQKQPLTLARPFSHSSRTDKPKYAGIYAPQTEPIQSAVGTWTAAILLAAISGSVYFFTARPKHSGNIDIESDDQFQQSRARDNSGSTNSTDMAETSLPGHVGNLTQEQEEKLQQLWIATLQVFGVLDKEQAKALNSAANGTLVPVLSGQSVPASELKKKKRGWFGKKSDAEEPKAAAASGDDKYGLASKFMHALENASPEVIRGSFWSMLKHDHPDTLLLRFLRARKWDVEKALVMMISTFHWRSVEMHVDDDIMINGEESMLLDSQSDDPVKKRRGADFLEQIRTGESFLHGVDKLDRPMCFVRARLHHAGDQLEESLERYTIYVIELARFVVRPPSETACLVFDMTGFSLANMDYAPVKFMIKCFEANYPESLGVVLIHKAPWVFQGIWKIIKGLLDPVVANKVNFTNNTADMEAFIEKSRILKELGGDEDWELKYLEPVIGENDLMKDVETKNKIQSERDAIANEFEKATIEWIENRTGEDVRKRREELRKSLGANYWKLDPYIRARSFYDRAGLIQPGGNIQFYPSAAKETTAPATTTEAAAATPAAAPKVAHAETTSDDLD